MTLSVIRFGVSVTSSRKWPCQNHSFECKAFSSSSFLLLLLSVTFSVSDPVRVIRFGVSVTSSRKWSCQNHSVQRKVCFQRYV